MRACFLSILFILRWKFLNLIAFLYLTALGDSAKYALLWHDAVAGYPVDLTLAVTFFADLCHLKQSFTYLQLISDG